MLFCFLVVLITSLKFKTILELSFLLKETYVGVSMKRDFSSLEIYDVLEHQFEVSIP